MIFREIGEADIPSVFAIRLATDENQFTMEELEKHGITPQSVQQKLETTGKGWLCELNEKVVGFVITDLVTAEIWIIAVLPEFINRKIGTRLLTLAEKELQSKGHQTSWLITDPDKSLRAYSFYLKNGWRELKTENGILTMRKKLN